MSEAPPADADYVVLTEEPNVMRAHWIAGALEGDGIPTFVDEDNLADEFAISQKAMGLLRVRVLVPRDRLDEARTVFLNLSQPIPIIDEDEDEAEGEEVAADQNELQYRGFLIVIAVLVLVPLAVLMVQSCAQ